MTFFTRCTGWAFFFDGRCSWRNDWNSVQRLAQFANTLFTFATWFAVFTRRTWCTFFTRSTRCALFTRCGYNRRFFARLAHFAWGAFFTWSAFFTWGTLFARCAFFTRLALFVTAAIAVTALLAAIATLFVACRALRCGGFFSNSRSSWFFLRGEQADQRLYKALEQAWFGDAGSWSRCWGRGWAGFSRYRGRGTRWSCFDGGFLTNQSACRSGRLNFFNLGSCGSNFIAGLVGVGFRAVITQALNFEVWRFEVIVRQDDDAGAGAQFDLGDRVAFFVEQKRSHRDRHLGAHFGSRSEERRVGKECRSRWSPYH